jgi:SHAQKYF class myb-like DNA-binding protein
LIGCICFPFSQFRSLKTSLLITAEFEMVTESFSDNSEERGISGAMSQEGHDISASRPPTTTSANPSAGPGAIPSSLVPDLMKVYENMVGGNSSSQPAYNNAKHWSFENTTGTTIPPVPNNMSEAMKFAAATVVPSSIIHGGVPETAKTARAGSGRNLRKRSSSITSAPIAEEESSTSSTRGSKSRRKQKTTDGRWSKRFTWPDDLHRDFVAAVFDVGLKHSSPSAILEHMPAHEQINSERVKSHLQKYRINRNKSKREFMTAYDSSMANLLKDGPPKSGAAFTGPDAAAYVTYATMQSPDDPPRDMYEGNEFELADASSRKNKSRSLAPNREQHDTILIPRLTEEEKKTPIGASVGYLMGLFFTLKKQLNLQREAQAAAQAAANNKASMLGNMDDIHKFGHLSSGSQPAAYDVSGTSTAADALNNSAVLTTPSNPSMRVNIQESNMMKREMQYQMAFQNKMRLLKQQEEQKLGNKPVDPEEGLMDGLIHEDDPHKMDIAIDMMPDQGTGDDVQRQRGMSIGDDFWYTDCGDDQLFDFLMNN